MPSVVFGRNHLRFTSGIICGSGSFAVQFGDHFRSWDPFRSGIICGAVQIAVFETEDATISMAGTAVPQLVYNLFTVSPNTHLFQLCVSTLHMFCRAITLFDTNVSIKTDEYKN